MFCKPYTSAGQISLVNKIVYREHNLPSSLLDPKQQILTL